MPTMSATAAILAQTAQIRAQCDIIERTIRIQNDVRGQSTLGPAGAAGGPPAPVADYSAVTTANSAIITATTTITSNVGSL